MAIAIVVLSLAATLAMDRGSGRRQQFGDFEGRQGASGAGYRIRGRRYDAAGRDSLCRTDRAAAGRVASALRPETPEGGGRLRRYRRPWILSAVFFSPVRRRSRMGRFIGAERSRSRDPGGAPCNGNSEVVCLRNGTVNSRPCFAPGRNLSDSCIGKARGMLRGLFLCRFESLREAPPHALDYSEYLSITIFRPLHGAPPPWAKTVRDAAD